MYRSTKPVQYKISTAELEFTRSLYTVSIHTKYLSLPELTQHILGEMVMVMFGVRHVNCNHMYLEVCCLI